MTKKKQRLVDGIALVVIVGGFLAYYLPTHHGGLIGWERVIPLGLAALYWACRESLFAWIDRW